MNKNITGVFALGLASLTFGCDVIANECANVDNETSMEKLMECVPQGEAQTFFQLGSNYRTGRHVEANKNLALEWYLKAAEMGHMRAQNSVGYMYENVNGAVFVHYQEAATWYRKSAEQGYAKAQSNLANLLYKGWGVDQSTSEAISWYKSAAEQGWVKAQYNLGKIYDDGKKYDSRGAETDYGEAKRWYHAAAEQGHMLAQHKLGVLWELGKGVNQDYSQAIEWYKMAADQGHSVSQYKIGEIYRVGGYGVVEDPFKAMYWYAMAAEKNHPKAMFELAKGYGSGFGVERDIVKAFMLYSLAQFYDQTSSINAESASNKYALNLTHAQQMEATRLHDEWKDSHP